MSERRRARVGVGRPALRARRVALGVRPSTEPTAATRAGALRIGSVLGDGSDRRRPPAGLGLCEEGISMLGRALVLVGLAGRWALGQHRCRHPCA
jgi:hypothetical protein